MFAIADMSRSKLDATIVPAQTATVTPAGVTYATDPDASLLRLAAGTDSLQVRLTWEQLNALHATLDALLTDRSVTTAGHSDAPEVLADRDLTQPTLEPLAAGTAQWTIHGWRVILRITEAGPIAIERIDGMTTRDLRDFPTWGTLAEASDWLYDNLEIRPATTRS